MQQYLLRNFSELAERRAILMREEAQLWDILARDLKREAKRREEKAPIGRRVRDPVPTSAPETPSQEDKLFVRVAEAMKMMGLGRGSIYEEMNSGRLKVRKSGRKTMIAVADIQEWFMNLPERKK